MISFVCIETRPGGCLGGKQAGYIRLKNREVSERVSESASVRAGGLLRATRTGRQVLGLLTLAQQKVRKPPNFPLPRLPLFSPGDARHGMKSALPQKDDPRQL